MHTQSDRNMAEERIKKRAGAKPTKPLRHQHLTRLNSETPFESSYLDRLKLLEAIRREYDPKVSITDLINEAVSGLLEMEGIPKLLNKDLREGVEL